MELKRRYLAYIRHNPEGYWFRRKVYGWGWTPVLWQGWAALAVFIGVLLTILLPFLEYATVHTDMPLSFVVAFIVKILLWAAALISVCYLTGEPPRWQWGFPDDNT